jgi:DNA-binding MurR/RpiR family transcriptional regulator
MLLPRHVAPHTPRLQRRDSILSELMADAKQSHIQTCFEALPYDDLKAAITFLAQARHSYEDFR